MSNNGRTIHGGPIVLLFGLTLALPVTGLGASALAEEAVFEMREISVFEEAGKAEGDQSTYASLLSGQHASCGNEPNEEVKAYPKLKSRQPMYGTLTIFRSMVDPNDTLEFHFVIDASGEPGADPDDPSAAATSEGDAGTPKPEESGSLLESLSEALVGKKTKAREAKPAYDRLYFDVNRDLDLTNDGAIGVMKDPPPGALPPGEQRPAVRVFDPFDLAFDDGEETGARPIPVVARLRAYGPGSGYVQFVPTVARQGTIRIGKQEYTAVLAQSDMITGRFDMPMTNLYLTPVGDGDEEPYYFGGKWLCATREADGQLYTVSATPTGDKLTVSPYRGDFGLLEVRPGDKEIEKLGACGMLMSRNSLLVTLGEISSPVDMEKPRQGRLPVGDYAPMFLAVDFGKLAVSLSPNRYCAGGGDQAQEKPPAYCIKIRKDEPFVLDFSGKPSVLFTEPAREQTFKPGEQVRLEALLIDPRLDLMIRGLEDTSRKEEELKLTDPQGKEITIPRYARLDPTVVITDSSGKEVASGKMPFG